MMAGWGLLLPALTGAITPADIDKRIAEGPYSADWDQIKSLYKTPDWYRDGKFGFYTHWGVYSVPAFGSEWYPRNMYMPGDGCNTHQIATYGNLTVDNGYKEFIPHFRGEYFNATEWIDIFR
eukprot:Hpha_TRINITY_DN37356_c0_g1::TRINITY_DN37356_c0_g1_i1::g.103742::m.103742/K01206/FUCA; alpha-L-fucosidase